MKYVLLPVLLNFPLLYVAYVWFREEYLLAGKLLCYWQYILLCLFLIYSGYCLFSGVDAMLLNAKDFTYKNSRGLSFTGMWTYVIPGLIAPLIIFPRETKLYIFHKSNVGFDGEWIIATIGWLIVALTIVRHCLVV